MVYTVGTTDGFDYYAPADVGRRWGTATGTMTTTPGPFHGVAARFEGANNFLDDTQGSTTSRAGAFHLKVHSSTWGSATHVCPAQLKSAGTVKQSLWVHSDGSVSVRRGGVAGTTVLATSAAGVFPFDAWVYVLYSSTLATTLTGRCDVFLDTGGGGERVATASALQTTDAGPASATHVRIGNCLADANTVRLDVDDFINFYATSTEADGPVAYADAHAVACYYPVGPGDQTEMEPGAGLPDPPEAYPDANWARCAEPLGDGDTTYVRKEADTDPRDLYRVSPFNQAAPALPFGVEDDDWFQYRATLFALMRDDGGVFPRGVMCYRYRDNTGVDRTEEHRVNLTGSWRYYSTALDHDRTAMQTLQVGWGGGIIEERLQDQFRGSQLVAELWYPLPPGATATPPPTGGGTRWSVGWVG